MRTILLFTVLSLGCGVADSDRDLESDTSGDSVIPTLLDVEVTWNDGYAASPRFSFLFPDDGLSAVLTIDDGSFVHHFDVSDLEAGSVTVSVPAAPGQMLDFTLDVDAESGPLQGTGTVENGAYGEDACPALVSTRDGTPSEPEYFLMPIHADGYGDLIVLVDSEGALLWRHAAPEKVRTAKVSADGLGVWIYEQADGLMEFEVVGDTTLSLVGWDGTDLAEYTVPVGHHDWQVSDDENTLEILGREPMADLELQCGDGIWGDVIIDVDLETGNTEEIWGTVANAFPTRVECPQLQGDQEEVHYSYVNGYERYGDTRAASASGVVQALVIGAADGQWWELTEDPSLSELTVIEAGADLYDPMVRSPHSVVCTEGMDWGAGDAWDGNSLGCVAFHRRGFGQDQGCDTTDVFVVEPDTQTARYLAAFPAPGTPIEPDAGCSSTNSHGNTAIIGDPGPGSTRLAMWSANTGVLSVLDADVDADGADLTLDYVIRTELEGAWNGWFVSAYTYLGNGHTTDR